LKYNPFVPLTISARELAEGYNRFCENGQHDKLGGSIADDKIEDIEFMHFIHHAAEIGPFELFLDACEIIAQQYPDSIAYEQILIGAFGYALGSLSTVSEAEMQRHAERIISSAPLSKAAMEVFSGYMDDEVKAFLVDLQNQITLGRPTNN